MAARLWESRTQTEISDTARRITQPTLVLHARKDRSVPYEEGRRLASLLPEARLVTLESDNHILQDGEPAWGVFPRRCAHSWAMTIERPLWRPISPS